MVIGWSSFYFDVPVPPSIANDYWTSVGPQIVNLVRDEERPTQMLSRYIEIEEMETETFKA